MDLQGAKETNDLLGLEIRRLELLVEAFTHPSVKASSRRRRGNNGIDFQRLEFLGDRVLGLVVATYLFEKFEEETEGQLALRFADLVKMESLARVAWRLDLARYVRVSLARVGASSESNMNASILADTCEALIGAIYIDGGLAKAKEFILREWDDLLNEQIVPPQDAVTSLQIWTQGRSLGLPIYEVVSREGPAHSPNFEVVVAIAGIEKLSAKGPSKKMATRAAAEKMLVFLKGKAEAAV
tara:strand:+ start:2410 stop:3132 length:723 start_codon:yes stop_codon:yes gene_type:complete